ncbi:GNAT family N-acetyltransferase [Lacinutrix salivirga]
MVFCLYLNMNFSELKPITTKRLVLNLINENDIELDFALRSNPIVGQFINRPLLKDRTEAITHIQKAITLIAENKAIIWTIRDARTRIGFGTICLWNFSEDKKTAEVGYNMLPSYFGNRFMTEALKAVLQFGFKTIHLQTIEAYTSYKNIKSIQLLEKQEFKLIKGKQDEGFPDNRVYSLSV